MPSLTETFRDVLRTALFVLLNAVRAYVDSFTLYKCCKKKEKNTEMNIDEVDGIDVDVNVNNVNCCHYHSD